MNAERVFIVAKKAQDFAKKLRGDVLERERDLFIAVDEALREQAPKLGEDEDLGEGEAKLYKGYDLIRLYDYYTAFNVRKSRQLDEEQLKAMTNREREIAKQFVAGERINESDYIHMRPPSSMSDLRLFFKKLLSSESAKKALKSKGYSFTSLFKEPVSKQIEVLKEVLGDDIYGRAMSAFSAQDIKTVRIKREYDPGVESAREIFSIAKGVVGGEYLNDFRLLVELESAFREPYRENDFLILKTLGELRFDLMLNEARYELLRTRKELTYIAVGESVKYRLQDDSILRELGIEVPKLDRRAYAEVYGTEESKPVVIAVGESIFEVKATIDSIVDAMSINEQFKEIKGKKCEKLFTF